MDPNLINQIINLIDKSQNILLLTHAKADCDGLGSMISIYQVLQSLGKDVVAATNDPAPENLSFLPSINMVQNSISSKNFVITVDISGTPLNKIKYKLAEDQKSVNIVVTPSSGRYKPENVSFNHEAGDFDLIMTFDTGNLEHLGPIYDQNSELFFKVPVINVDHHASNTDYGQVNLVDMVAASTTEVVLGLLEEMEKKYQKKFVNEDIATLLLAGLITDTGSFQHANTSPHAMETAAKLLDKGARQQEIIKNLYKTKKLSTLKLWGTVLSKVETDPIYRLVWSSISKQDLTETGASSDESETIIDDLLSNAPGAEIIMLFKYNDEGFLSVSMRSTTNSVDVGKLCQEMGGGGHVRAAGYKKRDGSSLEQMISETLSKAREYQGKRLNIHPEDAKEIAQTVSETQTQQEPQVEKQVEEKPAKFSEASGEGQKEKEGPEKVQYLDFKDERKPEKAEEREEKPAPQANVQSNKSEERPPRPKRKRNRNRQRPAQENKPQEQKNPQEQPKPQAEQAPTPKPEYKFQERATNQANETSEVKASQPEAESKSEPTPAKPMVVAEGEDQKAPINEIPPAPQGPEADQTQTPNNPTENV